MKPIFHAIVIMAFLPMSEAAVAEWVKVGGNDETTAYADPVTIRKTGDKAKMWRLIDYKNVQTSSGKSYMSSKSQEEYDCAEEQARKLYFAGHTGNMGEGETVLQSSGPDDWMPVPPGSILKSLWQIACGKR